MTILFAGLDHIATLRPASTKGIFVQKVFLSTTMGPSVPVAV